MNYSLIFVIIPLYTMYLDDIDKLTSMIGYCMNTVVAQSISRSMPFLRWVF